MVKQGQWPTSPAIGVGSLLIFFTRPGLMELSNLELAEKTTRYKWLLLKIAS